MGHISPGGENLLDFLELRQGLSTYDGDLRDPYWWPQERPVPMRVARGPLGIPLPSMPGPNILCGVGAGPVDSSPVLTWILGYVWRLPRGVTPRLEWGHARALSSRALGAVSRFLQVDQGIRGFPSRLSHEAFPRGFHEIPIGRAIRSNEIPAPVTELILPITKSAYLKKPKIARFPIKSIIKATLALLISPLFLK